MTKNEIINKISSRYGETKERLGRGCVFYSWVYRGSFGLDCCEFSVAFMDDGEVRFMELIHEPGMRGYPLKSVEEMIDRMYVPARISNRAESYIYGD